MYKVVAAAAGACLLALGNYVSKGGERLHTIFQTQASKHQAAEAKIKLLLSCFCSVTPCFLPRGSNATRLLLLLNCPHTNCPPGSSPPIERRKIIRKKTSFCQTFGTTSGKTVPAARRASLDSLTWVEVEEDVELAGEAKTETTKLPPGQHTDWEPTTTTTGGETTRQGKSTNFFFPLPLFLFTLRDVDDDTNRFSDVPKKSAEKNRTKKTRSP